MSKYIVNYVPFVRYELSCNTQICQWDTPGLGKTAFDKVLFQKAAEHNAVWQQT